MTVINVQRLISRIKLLPQSLLLSPMAKVLDRLCLYTQCSLITTEIARILTLCQIENNWFDCVIAGAICNGFTPCLIFSVTLQYFSS